MNPPWVGEGREASGRPGGEAGWWAARGGWDGVSWVRGCWELRLRLEQGCRALGERGTGQVGGLPRPVLGLALSSSPAPLHQALAVVAGSQDGLRAALWLEGAGNLRCPEHLGVLPQGCGRGHRTDTGRLAFSPSPGRLPAACLCLASAWRT